MTINNLTLEDSSNYTCIANNDVGIWLQNGTIVVKGKLILYKYYMNDIVSCWQGII